MSAVAEMSEELSRQLVEVCQNKPVDVIMNALLSGVVTLILQYPEDEQANVAVDCAMAMFSWVADFPKQETLQ